MNGQVLLPEHSGRLAAGVSLLIAPESETPRNQEQKPLQVVFGLHFQQGKKSWVHTRNSYIRLCTRRHHHSTEEKEREGVEETQTGRKRERQTGHKTESETEIETKTKFRTEADTRPRQKAETRIEKMGR